MWTCTCPVLTEFKYFVSYFYFAYIIYFYYSFISVPHILTYTPPIVPSLFIKIQWCIAYINAQLRSNKKVFFNFMQEVFILFFYHDNCSILYWKHCIILYHLYQSSYHEIYRHTFCYGCLHVTLNNRGSISSGIYNIVLVFARRRRGIFAKIPI